MPHLRLLGGAALEGDSGPISGAATHRHSLALLALLALAPERTLSRGKVVGYLWPESAEKAARNRLGTCVHRLRGALGDGALVSIGSGLRLDRERVRCDVDEFRVALEAGDNAAAVHLYRGPFLDGFRLRGAPEFEHWVERERDRIRGGYRGALEALAQRAEAEGDPAAAAAWWRERARDDPYDGRVAARFMEALAASGNRTEAVRVSRRHAALVRDELDMEPDAEVQRIGAALRGEGVAPPRGGAGAGVGPADASGTAATSGSLYAAAPPLPPQADPRSLAVLPFEEVGPGRDETSAFADGLHHDLLTRLSRLEGMKVISRTSVLRYRGGDATIREIARDLGVGSVVEGGVQHAAGRVRLNVQLIDVGADAHRWAASFDREITAGNLFDIQSELAEKITASLRSKLTSTERVRVMEWTPTDDLEAYRLHAQGRARLDERTEEGMRRAVEQFEAALERDDDYALARVGLADALTLLYEYGHEADDAVLPRAEQAARRAVELDPELAEAHASLGLLHEARKEGPAAIRELERAVELQPGYAEAHNWLSWTNQLLGRAAPALESARRAVELNPLSPEAVSNFGVSLLMNGLAEEAVRESRRAGELQPTWNTPPFYEALALFDLQRYGEAAGLLRDLSVPWAGRGPEATLGLVHAAQGDNALAREIRTRLAADGELFAAGVIRAAMGQVDEAFRTFERVERWSYWDTLAAHHYYPAVLGPLRKDPRYVTVLGRVRGAWGLAAGGS